MKLGPITDHWMSGCAIIGPRSAAEYCALGRFPVHLATLCAVKGIGCTGVAPGGCVTHDGRPWCGCGK